MFNQKWRDHGESEKCLLALGYRQESGRFSRDFYWDLSSLIFKTDFSLIYDTRNICGYLLYTTIFIFSRPGLYVAILTVALPGDNHYVSITVIDNSFLFTVNYLRKKGSLQYWDLLCCIVYIKVGRFTKKNEWKKVWLSFMPN